LARFVGGAFGKKPLLSEGFTRKIRGWGEKKKTVFIGVVGDIIRKMIGMVATGARCTSVQ